MKPSELLQQCVEAMKIAEEHEFIDPFINLVWPKGSKGRFPIHGRLKCVNNAEDRVYGVRVADVLTYISRELKRGAEPQGDGQSG